jgi:hypothetical protein
MPPEPHFPKGTQRSGLLLRKGRVVLAVAISLWTVAVQPVPSVSYQTRTLQGSVHLAVPPSILWILSHRAKAAQDRL